LSSTTQTLVFLKRAYVAALVQTGIASRFHDLYWRIQFSRWANQHASSLAPEDRFENREAMYKALLRRESLDEQIVYLEFGVYKGASLRWWVEHNRQPDSVFVGFDSFRGLPENWGEYETGHFTTEGKIPQIDDDRLRYQVGLFQDTLPAYLKNYNKRQKAVVHLDADLWSSTLFVLISLMPILKAGDILIFDEFCDYRNEFRAFYELVMLSGIDYRVIASVQNFGKVAVRLL